MSHHGSWLDGKPSLVSDASVWINLIATGRAEEILRAAAAEHKITATARLELENGRAKGRQSATAIVDLIRAGLVQEVSLGRAEEAVFLDLVAGPAGQTLDDGEAATIAFALSANAIALIDERKATTLCARRYPNLRVMSTVDLLLSSLIKEAFDKDGLGECLFKALSIARMRVPDRHRTELCNLLGPERLRQCKSLPTAWRSMGALPSEAGRPG